MPNQTIKNNPLHIFQCRGIRAPNRDADEAADFHNNAQSGVICFGILTRQRPGLCWFHNSDWPAEAVEKLESAQEETSHRPLFRFPHSVHCPVILSESYCSSSADRFGDSPNGLVHPLPRLLFPLDSLVFKLLLEAFYQI